MKRLSTILLTVLMLCGTAAVYAAQVPTIHEVYQAAHSGHLAQAQQMMDQVLAAHPNSAKAHFVEAEILTAARQYARANTELATAQRLEPGLSFEKPQAVTALQERIQQGLNGGVAVPHGSRSGISWVVILLIVGCVILLGVVIRALMTPKPMPAMYNGGVPPTNTMGTMGGSPMYPNSPMGGGLMSGLTTGLGVGAGIAAGEALVNHFTHGQSGAPINTVVPDTSTQMMDDQFANNDLGGNDFGMNDNSGWDDNNVGGDFSDFGGGDDGGWS
jgi:hypothetical protein